MSKQQAENDWRQRQRALSRWENEGGAEAPGPETRVAAVHKSSAKRTRKPPMKTIPAHAIAYNKTPIFTNGTVPKTLLNSHRTPAGIWGLIQVEHGTLQYTIEGKVIHTLTPGSPGVIEPEITHFVTPLDDVAFFVEFYREEQH